MTSELRVLTGNDVYDIVSGEEAAVLELVRRAYIAHGRGDSTLPHSVFLRFPKNDKNRIIGLPAYLGENFNIAGMKWISSFPENLDKKLERASAAIILNSMENGRPLALLEGSIISAKRTAASAALAAQVLHEGRDVSQIGFVGCGLISFEIARFLLTAINGVKRLVAFDTNVERAQQFTKKVERDLGLEAQILPTLSDLLSSASLISFATSAPIPYIEDSSQMAPGATLLHISLRDLSPKIILSSDNVVDDLDHVCRANTSIHLTEQQVGHRDFVRCSLAEILEGITPSRKDRDTICVFSPFGLGVLDLALSQFVLKEAIDRGLGIRVPSFLPPSWVDRE